MTTTRTELTLSAPSNTRTPDAPIRDARVRDRLTDLLRLADRADARGHHQLAAYYRERIVVEVWGPAA